MVVRTSALSQATTQGGMGALVLTHDWHWEARTSAEKGQA